MTAHVRSRRSFLNTLRYPLAAVAIPGKVHAVIGSFLIAGEGGRDRGVDALLRSPSARLIGRQCLKEGLRVSDALPLGYLAGVHPADTDRALWTTLKSRMEEDFANGETVRLSGWVLSRTEVRLYLLAARLELEEIS